MKPTKGGNQHSLVRIVSGVPNLDEILGGGLPEFSTNIVAGSPGSGKTILSQQIGYANARPDAKVLYISTLSEPSLKIIRYQSQFSFFREDMMDKMFYYRTVADVFRKGGLASVLKMVRELITEIEPRFIFIDSFKALADLTPNPETFRIFIYDLIIECTSHQCTSFLVGEYDIADLTVRPEFAMADSILYLYLAETEDQPRYLEVRKLRGSKFKRGRHPFEITRDGITCYPHPEPTPIERQAKLVKKVSTRITGIDAMSGGGFYEGSISIVAGSAGTGKTSFAVKFLGKDGLLVSLEEKPGRIERYATNMELEVPDVLYISPMQFIPERATQFIKERILKTKPKRIALDGFSEMGMDKDVLYDLLDFLVQQGITTVLLYEIHDAFGAFSSTPTGASRLVDNVILLRYVELNGKIERLITILKMRGSAHDREIRLFEIAKREGMRIGERVRRYSGLMTGIGQPVDHMVGEELAKGFRF